MASPFKFFRKNQTQLLVVIGLLTMVAFIILPSVLQMMQVSGNIRTSNDSVVTQKYGNLTSNDMLRLKAKQSVTAGFFSRLAGVYQGKLQQLMAAQQQDAFADFQKCYLGYMLAQQNLAQVSNQSDRAVVANWLMENKAADMGITVSDAMVTDFISKATDGLNTAEYNVVVYGEAEPTSFKSEDTLIEAVRSFMVRNAMLSVYGASWEVSTTGDRLDSFSRMNQFANVELYPVNVANFIEKVADPTDAEIKGFFEVNKDKEANDSFTGIGLRQPQKIVVDYCTASLASFLKPETVTDEQVQKYYDDNKENFVVEKKDDNGKTAEIGKMPDIGLNTKEYKPLDDTLKNDIRQALAYQNAQEQMKLAIGKVQKAMEEYTAAKDAFEMNFTEEDRAKEEIKAQAPKAVDFTALAKENGLTYGNTGLISMESFANTPLANLRLADTDTTIPAVTELFGKTPTFRVGIYESQDGSRVIAWKCDDSPAHTPTLEEDGVKDQIIAQFKFRAAKELAKAEADKLATQAIAAKLPLKVCLGETAFVPPQFTWFTFAPITNPNMERRIYLSAVEGVKEAGYEFMKTIFQMNAGDIKAIANASETTFYVTRMIELTPPNNQLYTRFIVTPENEYAQARTTDGQLFFHDLYEKLEKESGLEWKVRPDEDTER